jgi:hypothetical protein
MALAERGNCARYTSKGLEEGRIIKHASMWPKSLWVRTQLRPARSASFCGH